MIFAVVPLRACQAHWRVCGMQGRAKVVVSVWEIVSGHAHAAGWAGDAAVVPTISRTRGASPVRERGVCSGPRPPVPGVRW